MTPPKNFTRIAVIMAGGSGERFWPLSRKNRPKQLLKLTHPTDTMLAEAVNRLQPLIPHERIYIVTGEHLQQAIQEADLGIPPENVLAEPSKRNTTGCLTYAAAHMLAKYGGDGSTLSMAVTTADHMIGEPDTFRAAVDAALTSAEQDGVLATHGIVPTRPDTGYGYIQAKAADPRTQNGIKIYDVDAFHEKPNRQKAEDFIETGHYYWNSGMFFWRIDTFMEEMKAARPDIAAATQEMVKAMTANDKGTVGRVFDSLEDISIDYALMEHARRVVVIRAEYPWDDVGSWPSLDRTRDHDAQGNVAVGDPIVVDCEDCIIYNEVGAKDMALSVVGCEGIVVVVSKDGILVIPKDRAQDVRHAVKELRALGSRHV